MDWSRAKTILIYVVLTLNIILLLFISSYKLDINASRQMIADTTQIMKNRGIVIECEIPVYNDKSPWLIFEDGRLDRHKLMEKLFNKIGTAKDYIEDKEELSEGSRKVTFLGSSWFKYSDENPSEHIDIFDRDEAEKYVKSFLSGLGLYIPQYKLDNFVVNPDNSITFHYIEKKNGFLVFDNFTVVTLAGGGVSSLEYKHREIKGFTSDSLPVLPAYKILLKNFSYGENITITGIDIGFKGYKPEQEIKEYSEAPAWRITIKGGTPRFFKASDGEEIKELQ